MENICQLFKRLRKDSYGHFAGDFDFSMHKVSDGPKYMGLMVMQVSIVVYISTSWG